MEGSTTTCIRDMKLKSNEIPFYTRMAKTQKTPNVDKDKNFHTLLIKV